MVIGLVAGSVLFGYNYAANAFKSFAAKYLENNFNAKVSVGHIALRFPLRLELKEIKINDTVDIAKICVYPSPASFLLKDTFVFSSIRIMNPVVRLNKAGVNVNDFLKNSTGAASPSGPKKSFYFSRIDVIGGVLVYDLGNDERLEFTDIKGVMKNPNFYFSAKNPISFKVAGFIKNKNPDALSPLQINGQVSRGGRVKAKCRAESIGIDTLGPLCPRYIKTTVANGKLFFDAKLQFFNSNLKADCFFRLDDIVLNKEPPERLGKSLIAGFILGFDFKENKLKIRDLQGNLASLIFDKS